MKNPAFIEGLFAEAKDLHGIRRARYRGRAKVQIQAYIVASIQNLKRLVTVMPDFIRFMLEFAIFVFAAKKLRQKMLSEKFWMSPTPS